MCIFCVHGMALYRPTLQFYVCMYVWFAGRYVAPLVSVITTLYYVARLFFIVECGIARLLCTMHVFDVWASSSSPRLPLCQISLVHSLRCWASTWRKIVYSLSHSPSLFDAPGTEACASEQVNYFTKQCTPYLRVHHLLSLSALHYEDKQQNKKITSSRKVEHRRQSSPIGQASRWLPQLIKVRMNTSIERC